MTGVQTCALPISADLTQYVPATLGVLLQRRGRLPCAEALPLTLALADALAHLHASGLVHRDIKPSNVVFVGGRPKLADIGLVARVAGADTLVGTLGYIPPEGPGSPAADIYSLGRCSTKWSRAVTARTSRTCRMTWPNLESALG